MSSRRRPVISPTWFQGPEQQEKVKAQLGQYGINPEAIVAHTYAVKSDQLDKLHRLLAVAEVRRATVIRYLDEYRVTSSLRQSKVVVAEPLALVANAA